MFKLRKEMDMIHGPLMGKILFFTVPLMISNILQLLFNAADVVIVGRFAGDASLAAVGSTSSLINLIINLFVGLSVGTNVVVAKNIGTGEKDKVNRIAHSSIMISVISGMILIFIGIVFSPFFLKCMGTPDNVMNLAVLYLRIYFLGMPFTMLYNFGSALLRAKGDTQRPMIFLFLSGMLNVVLNCFFVIVFSMDVAGVGLATVISQGVSATLVLWVLFHEEEMLRLSFSKLKINKEDFKDIIRIGLPAGVQGIVFSFSNVVVQSSVNSFGSITMAGSAASINLGNFIYMATNAFNQTGLSFNGQNTGAKLYDRVDKVTSICVGYVFVIGTVLSVLAYMMGRPLLGIYSTSPDVIEAGMVRMKYNVLFYGLCGLMDVMPGCIRGMGYSIVPMITSLIGSCALRIIWVMTIFHRYPTPEVLYISYPISWIVTFGVHVICFAVIRKRLRAAHQE